MKLSPFFVEVLKNFSTINTGMIFKPGNMLRTMDGNKTILAQAELDVSFDREFGIYDLNRLLALLSMNKGEQEIEVEDNSLVIFGLGGRGKIRQRFTDVNLILAPVAVNLSAPTYECEFAFNNDVFTWIFNASSILDCPHTVVKGEIGKPMTIHAIDVKGQLVDSAYVTLDTVATKRFSVVLKNSNIKVINGEYDVQISKTGFAHFKHKTKKVEYWIAIEGKNSTFES